MGKQDIYFNTTDKPIRFVSHVKRDPFGGPGEETFFLIMPGKGIDVGVLGLAKEPPEPGRKGRGEF